MASPFNKAYIDYQESMNQFWQSDITLPEHEIRVYLHLMHIPGNYLIYAESKEVTFQLLNVYVALFVGHQ